LQLAAEVAQDPAGVAFQLFQCFAHAAELFGMRVTAHLRRQWWRKPVVVLPQIDPALHGQGDQLAAGFLVELCIGRMGNVLFHDGGVDSDARQAVTAYGTRFAPCLNGLGQQPLDPFLADPLSPAHQ
jgi:hypothetical protein